MNWPNPRIIYSQQYDIRFFGLEKWHAFDSTKYSRAWRILRDRFGQQLDRLTSAPTNPISDEELLVVHDAAYLKQLKSSSFLAHALELPGLRFIPNRLLQKAVVGPMRWATAGTILAAEMALQNGAAFNLSGGYHHASHDNGEGFCLFADIVLSVVSLRDRGLLASSDPVGVIDLDAHQGNGTALAFKGDSTVVIMDAYNRNIYPRDNEARSRVDIDIPLDSGTTDQEYLEAVERGLDDFYKKIEAPKLVLYNAGTDIFTLDPLGGMSVSGEGVLRRDELVFSSLLSRNIPFVILPSGGYTKLSARMIANSISLFLGNGDRSSY